MVTFNRNAGLVELLDWAKKETHCYFYSQLKLII